MGREYSDADIKQFFGPSEEGIFQRLIPGHWEACVEAHLHVYERLHHLYPVAIPGIAQMLDKLLNRGLGLAVVTGKGPGSASVSLRHLGLTEYFSVVETGSPQGDHKVESIGKVLARWGIEGQKAGYVGDMPADMRAAKEAGVVPLGAAWAPSAESNSLRRDGAMDAFADPRDFVSWIESHINLRGDAR